MFLYHRPIWPHIYVNIPLFRSQANATRARLIVRIEHVVSPTLEWEADQVKSKFSKILGIADSSSFEATAEPRIGSIGSQNVGDRFDREGIDECKIGERGCHEYHMGWRLGCVGIVRCVRDHLPWYRRFRSQLKEDSTLAVVDPLLAASCEFRSQLTFMEQGHTPMWVECIDRFDCLVDLCFGSQLMFLSWSRRRIACSGADRSLTAGVNGGRVYS